MRKACLFLLSDNLLVLSGFESNSVPTTSEVLIKKLEKEAANCDSSYLTNA